MGANNDFAKTLDYLVNGLPSNSLQPTLQSQSESNKINKCNETEVINAICKCGSIMKQTSTNYCRCDGCNELMKKGDIIFSCPKGQDSLQHPNGYDLCIRCAKNTLS